MLKLLLVGLLLVAQTEGSFEPDPDIVCTLCSEWNREREPFRVFGNTYYVGVEGLSAVLITTDEGLILVDGALSQSAPLIDRNIRQLGFRTEDLRYILSSHAHFDHAGGIAGLQRASGATVLASPRAAEALKRGAPNPDDPQAADPDMSQLPSVPSVQAVQDGESVSIGGQTVTAHFTPGHTPGGTSWTWRSCEQRRCLDIVYVDSLTAVSTPEFRFTGDATRPSIIDSFRTSIATVAKLPCDIFIPAHPGSFFDQVDRRDQGLDDDALIDPDGCRNFAANASKALDERIAKERSAP